jgi:chemotaxis protein histidine kinase CheA
MATPPVPSPLLAPYREKLGRELPWLLRELEFSIRTLGTRPSDGALRRHAMVSAHSLAQRAGTHGFDASAKLCRSVSALLVAGSLLSPAIRMDLERLADGLSSVAADVSRRATA